MGLIGVKNILTMSSSFIRFLCFVCVDSDLATQSKSIASSVMEPFHFGLAPASQDGGFSSSSNPVVHNLLLKKLRKISFLNLPGLLYSQKCTSALLCSSST